MKEEIKKFIIDWNNNTHKLNSESFWGGKTPLDLIMFCFKNHKKITSDKLLYSLIFESNNLKSEIRKYNQFLKALEFFHHNELLKGNTSKRNYKYEKEKNYSLYDIELQRVLDYTNNTISIPTVNQNTIDKAIIKKFNSFSHFDSSHAYSFIFYQAKQYDFDSKRINKWFLLNKKSTDEKWRNTFFEKLPLFVSTFFSIESKGEKIELWVEYCFMNKGYEYFERFIDVNLDKFNNYIIDVYKENHYQNLLKKYHETSKISIDSEKYRLKEVKRLESLLGTQLPPLARFDGSESCDYYSTYNKLINGDRNFDKMSEKNLAGRVEAITDFIIYLKNQKINKSKNKLTSAVYNKNLLPIEIFENTRDYLKKNAIQINSCYHIQAYDACSILLRKITEILIIEIYEKEKIEHKIKDQDGNYVLLKGLINRFTSEESFKNILSRNTKDILPKIKRNGDLSAHNRKYISTKHDIDKLSDDFRVIFQELINTIYH